MSKKLVIIISVLAVALVILVAGVGLAFAGDDTVTPPTSVTCPNTADCPDCPMMQSGGNAGNCCGGGNCPMMSTK